MRNQIAISEGTKGGDTRVRILASALELFRENGFEATTMRDIAVKAGVATGAAYYYFPSKDAIVLAFYDRATSEMAPQLELVLAGGGDLRKRLAGILDVKLRYFEPSRRLLAALAAHTDPEHPLSPFSEQSREIRERDISIFERALLGSRIRIADDLKASLPRLLWLYQMGLILYWIYDKSPAQQKTALLVDKSLGVIMRLLQLSSLPLMGPVRRKVLELIDIVSA